MMLHRLASFGRSSVEIGVGPNGSAIASPSVQEAGGAGRDDLPRVLFQRRAHRRGEVHLVAPGAGARCEGRRREERPRRRRVGELDVEPDLLDDERELHPPRLARHGARLSPS